MDAENIQAKVNELVDELRTLPEHERLRIETLAAEANGRQNELKETVDQLQSSIDYLRMSIKYVLFDLEATRRENNYLRQMIENEAQE